MAQPGKDDALNMLRGWFERDLGRYARWDRDIEMVEQLRDGTVRIKIYTDLNCYAISARPGASYPCHPEKPRDPNVVYSYMGCISECRKPRAGEDWHRGSDLRDGDLSEATWIGIMGDIISYEMVRVHKDDSRSVGPRGAGIIDNRADTPPTHTAKPAEGTILVSEDGKSATAWPPGMGPTNGGPGEVNTDAQRPS
jgi:hypothetical protein